MNANKVTTIMKKLSYIKQSNGSHWVGDGFPVRNIFSYTDIAEEISPFLMMDYAGPHQFEPTEAKRGVGEHPHKGFETVTIVYDGEVEHRDSAGGGGKIGPGDVQWMTAASGLVHEEFHGRDFAKNGGKFEMIQLWVNLSAKDKKAPPKYQTISNTQIPEVKLSGDAGIVRVIAGQYGDHAGPASTFSPMNVWDLRIKGGSRVEFKVNAGDTTTLFVLKGKVGLQSGEELSEADLAVFERDGDTLVFNALEDSKLLFLNGKPLNEPVVGYGPFVMNTEAEIRQAFMEYRSGRMGHLS